MNRMWEALTVVTIGWLSIVAPCLAVGGLCWSIYLAANGAWLVAALPLVGGSIAAVAVVAVGLRVTDWLGGRGRPVTLPPYRR